MNTAKAMRGELLIVAAIVLGLAGYAHCQSQVVMSTTIVMTDHATKAAPGALATPQSLLEPNAVTFAHGELPNSDIPIGAKTPEVPLGTIARWYRQNDNRPRATFVREAQGGQQ